MPKIWSDTIETHRQTVREATLDATATLVAERGLASVTMSEIAERTGIGRATLYKYFPDIESILVAWHERHINAHLAHLAEILEKTDGSARARLGAVLENYALISQHRGDSELASLLHRGKHVVRAERHLKDFIRDLISEGVHEGDFRDDIAPAELASYCLHALGAARGSTKAVVHRLVEVTMAGLRPSTRQSQD